MTMNSADVGTIVKSTVDGFRVRVAHHSVDLSDDDLARLEGILFEILQPIADDGMVQRRQYNPKTDTVEDL